MMKVIINEDFKIFRDKEIILHILKRGIEGLGLINMAFLAAVLSWFITADGQRISEFEI
jgi:hypothetical protein